MPSLPALHPRDMPRLKRAEVEAGEWLPANHKRPQTRAECGNAPRPCPYVGCRYHLFLTVTPAGGIKMPYGEDVAAIKEMSDTCALDVAERGGMELGEMARLLRLTLEGVLLIVNSAYGRLALTDVVREQSDGRKIPTKRRKIMTGKQGPKTKAEKLAESSPP